MFRPVKRKLLFAAAVIIPFLCSDISASNRHPDYSVLHERIVRLYDEGKYAATAELLAELRAKHPERYAALPYILLHAGSHWKAGNPRGAWELYLLAEEQKELARFTELPLARIAAAMGWKTEAVRWYRRYLKNLRAPRYLEVAVEALEYCMGHEPSSLLETARVIQSHPSTKRLGQFYMAKAYLMRNEKSQAKSLFLTLIRASRKDDVTSRSLQELDRIDGNELSDSDLLYRGRLAYEIWNFDLARKYLAPVSSESAEATYYYGRALFFLNNLAGAKKMFEQAVSRWPDDPMAKLSLYQWANVSMRNAEYDRAVELYMAVEKADTGRFRQAARRKRIQALRAQSDFTEALQLLSADYRSGDSSTRGQAGFLRARVYYQTEKYREALADLENVLKISLFSRDKEVLLWKGIVLEKLNRSEEAEEIYDTLAAGDDFYAHQAQERIQAIRGKKYSPSTQSVPAYSFARLPDASDENTILNLWSAGEPLTALLYLHLYEEASVLLPTVSQRVWDALKVDGRDRQQRYLSVAFLAGLGGDYQTATYYSELFLNNLPRTLHRRSLPVEILTVLFPIPYRDEILKFCRDRDLDPLLVLAIMRQESKFRKFARSQSFARGLMQLIPPTAFRMASSLGLQEFSLEQLYHPETNINLGTRYMRDLSDEFGSRIEILAAGYNGGESNVRRWMDSSGKEMIDFFSNIDMKETKDYVMIVKSNYELYKKIYGTL